MLEVITVFINLEKTPTNLSDLILILLRGILDGHIGVYRKLIITVLLKMAQICHSD